jgi:hypothetical protein
MRLLSRNGTASVPPNRHENSQLERSPSFGYFDKLPPLPFSNSKLLNTQSATREIARERQGLHQSLNVGSMHPPQTQGKVQSAVRLPLSGTYLLQASARTGLIDCQMTSKVPEEFILPIMTGLEE